MSFDLDILADQIAAGLQGREDELRLEQSVYGMDSLDELPMQQLLAAQLATHFSVAREVHYPLSAGKQLSHRNRCDLVLSPLGKPLKLDREPTSLFDPPEQCDPSDALWLEVKLARQFRAPGERHSGYGQQWRTTVVDDLRKMEADELIRRAALLLIVCTEDQSIVDKDLQLFEDLLVLKEVLAGFRQTRHIAILDRIGHRCMTVALFPTIWR
jgi:hypothetical protein